MGITISYNTKNKGEYRLVSNTSHKKFYFGNDDQRKRDSAEQRTNCLNLTEDDLDKVNNCVTLRIRSVAKWGKVCDRRLFYLERDGPRFIQFLLDHGRIDGLNQEQHFKRHTVQNTEGERVTSYCVTLNKDDWTNKMASNFVSNWAMQQTSQLRVHMNADNTVKYFALAESTGCLKFTIDEISTYDEEHNRVLLKIMNAEEVIKADFRGLKVRAWGAKNRWLHLGSKPNQNTDSKKFLLFLMEMYHKDYNTSEETTVFSNATAASIPTLFQGQDETPLAWQEIARQYLGERQTDNERQTESAENERQRDDARAGKFAAICQFNDLRHRLVEAELFA